MHRPLSQAAGPKSQFAPGLPPPLGKQTGIWVVPSAASAWRQAKPSGQVPEAQVTLHSRAVPRSRQVPLWQGARPGEQSSPKRPPMGAQMPVPLSGPVAVRCASLQS